MSDIAFPAPPSPAYPGGCTLEPAWYALDHLVNWQADVRVNGRTFEHVNVLAFLRDVTRHPGTYGVTHEAAREARDRFLSLSAQVLEPEGGSRSWLEREFDRP